MSIKLSRIVFAVCLGLGCGVTAPDTLPEPRFGEVAVLLRDKLRISQFGDDSAVVTYDTLTQRLIVNGANSSSGSSYFGLALDYCGPLESREYAFARTPNGPFGFAAYPLGIVGEWWEPVSNSAQRNLGINAVTSYMSHGESTDRFTIEELDLVNMRIRGSFQFRGYTTSGVSEIIGGRFYGRLAYRKLPCAIP